METLASSRAIIDLKAYGHNLQVIQGMLPKGCAVMAVVKANAYGHGSVAIAQRALQEGAAMLGVATVEEAIVLRQAGIEAPIVVMVQPPDYALSAAIEHGLRLVLSDVSTAERLGELAQRVNKVAPIHFKVDTGMGRGGHDPEQAVAAMRHLTHISHVDVEGVATHLAVAEDPRDPFTANQIRQFRHLLRLLDKEGVPYETAHAAASACIVNHPSGAFDMVRPGLMTYGVWPTDTMPTPCPLRPVMRWESVAVLLKDLPAGHDIGYGRTFTAARPTRVAIVPVGYADGFRFQLGNNADVLIRGARCPVRGRVSMDQIVVDVTDVPGAVAGDVVTLVGSDGAESITIAELARRVSTTAHDILTGIGPRVHRCYVNAN